MAGEISFIGAEDISTVNGALSSLIAERFADVELVEVRYFRQYGTPVVELLLWKKDDISLNDCEAVHNAVSNELDNYDSLFKEPYNLNISSMGLDRKIETDDDFRRSLDTEIECIGSDKKKIHGVLKSYDADSIVLIINSNEKTIKRNNLTKVQPYVRF